MAFFKFRSPGQDASSEALGASPGEGIEVLRRRARHRLMGAVVLVSLAVVGFPLVFDTQPRPVAVDTPILMPDRYPTDALRGAAQAPVQPLTPALPALPAQAGLDDNEEQVALPSSDPGASSRVPAQPPAALSAPAAPAKPQALAEKNEAKSPVKPAAPQPAKPESKPRDDGSKARALLEGRTPPPPIARPSASAPTRHVVQVGAFTDPAKVREVRRKLEQAGWVTFIQVIDGKASQPTTRIRVGPFASREEADQAAAKIRRLDLSPAVLKL